MTKNRNMYYFDMNEDNVSYKIARTLSSLLDLYFSDSKEIVILCIGSDRVTGDSLGPLIGYKLQNTHCYNPKLLRRTARKKMHIYGTLDFPVHAMNLESKIKEINFLHPDIPIIAIDASLGNNKYLGYITVGVGSLHPGTGVHKQLPSIGDFYITGIVGSAGAFEQMTLQTTRLAIVMKLADTVATGLSTLFSPISGPLQ